MQNKNLRKLITFFVLTFILSWGADAFRISIVSQAKLPISNEVYFTQMIKLLFGEASPYLLVILSTFVFGPLLAAVITVLIFDKIGGLTKLLKTVVSNAVNIKWIGVAILIHGFLVCSSLLVGFILSGFTAPKFAFQVPIENAIAFLVYLIVFTGLAEEVGWRGFALPLLLERYSLYKASVILGIIWGIWHFPVSIYSNLQLLHLLPLTLIGLIAGTAGWSVVVSWYYLKSKSLVSVIFLHGVGNFFASYFILSLNYPMANFFYGFAPWIIVFILEKIYGKDSLNTYGNWR